LFGNDGELHLAFLNVKNCVRNFSLGENNLILPAVKNRFPVTNVGEEFLGIKRRFDSLPQTGGPSQPRVAC
jgi:hypothetical protein